MQQKLTIVGAAGSGSPNQAQVLTQRLLNQHISARVAQNWDGRFVFMLNQYSPSRAARCRLITYRQRFTRAAPAPRAKRFDSKNRGRASPVYSDQSPSRAPRAATRGA